MIFEGSPPACTVLVSGGQEGEAGKAASYWTRVVAVVEVTDGRVCLLTVDGWARLLEVPA